METIFIKEDYVLLFYAIKKLLTAYHIDKSSTGKIIEPKKEAEIIIHLNESLSFFAYFNKLK
ncbi:hypothetical protein DM469_04960 [Lactobacillus helveticus]|uniref:Uncharacterized protein n=1 Tax=Lactobacillus helveticus TaxID=1587 RepID=A0AAU8XUR0_LACHE|nr:hypothetical protein Lh8105_06825 [Lactobacillus helveticus]PXZ13777.1 hypothetical protein DM470_04550 [Lactobacillus helveticus]PXZ22971.1 hypothetical protein DM468_05175 [Lactobacillus helveticus]PXZ29092.1 hypothetical protein DM467_05375 [Lactobacillus helveticus]PXZ35279.1 hypothetical protein DM469_04960 [Lactobacillus helveticus]